jgi:hypothetical protein
MAIVISMITNDGTQRLCRQLVTKDQCWSPSCYKLQATFKKMRLSKQKTQISSFYFEVWGWNVFKSQFILKSFFFKGCWKSSFICFTLPSSSFLQVIHLFIFLPFFIKCLNLSLDLDFEFVCCVVHLLWSFIINLYVVCSFVLELDSWTSFKFNIVCVLCVHMLRQFLWIMSYNLIFEWTSNITLFLCCMFVCFVDCCKSCNLIFKQASSSTLFMCYVFICFINCCKSCNKLIKWKLHQAN